MANSPFIDLTDEVSVRRYLSDLDGVIRTNVLFNNSNSNTADMPKLVDDKAIKEEIQKRVKEFSDRLQATIDEVQNNLRLISNSPAAIIKTVNDELDVSTSDLVANVKSTAVVAIGEDGTYATAQSVTDVASNLGDNYSKTSVIDGTYATKTSVGAIHEVAVEANGHVSGYKSVATDTNSVFDIYAEQFAISSSATEEGYEPFQVDTANHKINMTSDVAVDGNLLIDGTITAAKVATNALTADVIDVNSINMTDLSGAIDWNTQIINKPAATTIPTKLSELENDTNFITPTYTGFTHIDAYGIYTGSLTVNQITASGIIMSDLEVV